MRPWARAAVQGAVGRIVRALRAGGEYGGGIRPLQFGGWLEESRPPRVPTAPSQTTMARAPTLPEPRKSRSAMRSSWRSGRLGLWLALLLTLGMGVYPPRVLTSACGFGERIVTVHREYYDWLFSPRKLGWDKIADGPSCLNTRTELDFPRFFIQCGLVWLTAVFLWWTRRKP